MSVTLPPQTAGDNGKTGPAAVGTGDLVVGRSLFTSHDEAQAKRAAGATLATVGLHGLFVLIAVLLFAYHEQTRATAPDTTPLKFVYLQQAGPGGGGGGNAAPAPPKPMAVPRSKAPEPIPIVPPPPDPPPPPVPTLTAPIMTNDRDLVQATGANSVSLATVGGGGRGTGIGPGTGSGVGPGTGGGFGGGAYRMGSGITNPVPLKEMKPVYTSDAMRAKIQGVVQLEAVVDETGTVRDVRVTRSLDKLYGLDQEAMKAARLWLFRPARDRDNKAVPIIITLELEFRLH